VSWKIQKRVAGAGSQEIVHVFATYPALGVNEARDKAQEIISKIRQGINPNALRKQHYADMSSSTFNELFDVWWTERNDGSVYWRRVKASYERDVKETLGRSPVKVITKAEMWSVNNRHSGSVPRKLKIWLRSMWGWLAERDVVENNIIRDIKIKPLDKSRARVLSKEEIRAYWICSGGLPLKWRVFFRTMLLCATRRREHSLLKWSDLDLGGKRLHIRRESRKGKRNAFTQPLSDLAVAEFNLLPRTSQYVFIGSKGAATVQNFYEPKVDLDERMKRMLPHFQPFRNHDAARHSVASHLAEMGVNIDVCDKLLGHERNTSDTKWLYQHSDLYAQRAEALNLRRYAHLEPMVQMDLGYMRPAQGVRINGVQAAGLTSSLAAAGCR
jgi:integrase